MSKRKKIILSRKDLIEQNKELHQKLSMEKIKSSLLEEDIECIEMFIKEKLHFDMEFVIDERYEEPQKLSVIGKLKGVFLEKSFIQENILKLKGNEIREISDGHHTFEELYKFRMLYNAAFFNNIKDKTKVYKSFKHSDGELCFGGGWFVVVAILPTGQITNHYEEKYWDLFKIPAVEKVEDEYDGHTPEDVAKRLEKYILEGKNE